MARWDWYQSTVQAECPEKSGLVSALLAAWPLSDLAPARNLNGYHYGAQIQRGGRTLCHFCWGGNPGINCKSTGEESPTLAEALRSFQHMPTRVDACEDWREPGLFDRLAAELTKFATDKGLSINQQGDWVRGEARTLYLGSKDSPVRLVLYEKGYELGGNAPKDLVRLEVRVRPKRAARDLVARWQPGEAFGAAWVPDALERIGWDHLERFKVGTIWRPSDEQRARAALLRQYGAIIEAWADEAGGWEALGPAIGQTLREQRGEVSEPA